MHALHRTQSTRVLRNVTIGNWEVADGCMGATVSLPNSRRPLASPFAKRISKGMCMCVCRGYGRHSYLLQGILLRRYVVFLDLGDVRVRSLPSTTEISELASHRRCVQVTNCKIMTGIIIKLVHISKTY
jgi:hypothetical protein